MKYEYSIEVLGLNKCYMGVKGDERRHREYREGARGLGKRGKYISGRRETSCHRKAKSKSLKRITCKLTPHILLIPAIEFVRHPWKRLGHETLLPLLAFFTFGWNCRRCCSTCRHVWRKVGRPEQDDGSCDAWAVLLRWFQEQNWVQSRHGWHT